MTPCTWCKQPITTLGQDGFTFWIIGQLVAYKVTICSWCALKAMHALHEVGARVPGGVISNA